MRTKTNKVKTRERNVLLYLSEKGQECGYQLAKHFVYSIGQTDRALDSLESQGFIKTRHTKPRRKGRRGFRPKGHNKDFHYITILGLLKALTYNLKPKRIRDIVERNRNKAPVIFKEWDYFVNSGNAKEIVQALRYLYFSYETNKMPSGPWVPRLPRLNRVVLTNHVLFNRLPLLILPNLAKTATPLEQRLFDNCQRMAFEWINTWANNPRLRKYLVNQIALKKTSTKDVLKRISELENRINNFERFKNA